MIISMITKYNIEKYKYDIKKIKNKNRIEFTKFIKCNKDSKKSDIENTPK